MLQMLSRYKEMILILTLGLVTTTLITLIDPHTLTMPALGFLIGSLQISILSHIETKRTFKSFEYRMFTYFLEKSLRE
ncbi:MAG: hypothetical protein DRP00_02245 [Candidatus Aenigmatarchaeota archaeon]|nr:MAG: hypothetical protein DRP00_02245 [Candidatus Aenigmarchaeota archaeon]